jgi:hypothetical protein
MGWKSKRLPPKKRNPYARELEDDRYRQRIKDSDKDHTRKKLNLRELEYDESSD